MIKYLAFILVPRPETQLINLYCILLYINTLYINYLQKQYFSR